MAKARLSASVDAHLIEAGRRAVEQGRAENLSAWVSRALEEAVARDERFEAFGEFVDWYEDAHGAFSEDDLARALERVDARTIEVDPDRPHRAS